MLDVVIKNDQDRGGLFSVPVPKDVFPEYYEVVNEPMDYGTMKSKLARGEYRSAQAMQKDFVLVMQNCVTFNAPDSDIVKEARRQLLSIPNLLKTAALSNHLFLTEDGTALEVYSDNDEKSKKGAAKKGRTKQNSRARKSTGGLLTKKENGDAIPKKTKRCRECEGCTRKDCGKCAACVDKPKFGGPGTMKQVCHERKCVRIKDRGARTPRTNSTLDEGEVEDSIDDRASEKVNTLESDTDETSDTESEADSTEAQSVTDSPGKKPRIRISLSSSSNKKESNNSGKNKKSGLRKKKKKPRRSYDDNESSEDASNGISPRKRKKSGKSENEGKTLDTVPRKKRKRQDSKDTNSKDSPCNILGFYGDDGKASEGGTNISSSGTGTIFSIPRKRSSQESEEKDIVCAHMNRSKIKKEYNALDGSFASIRAFFTARGPWALPSAVGEDKYLDVAKHTLNKMYRHDRYSLFAEPVSDDEAPGYSAAVASPMDFGTMKARLDNGDYGFGSKAIERLYSDFLLVMDNCVSYNEEDSDVGKEATRLLGLLPEVFASACIAVSG
eukprot:CAMPEP_0195514174 /NCGR_PEP_ID=MMETSP0794_2-20130614/5633_1 /TAXON_ID=515487 /ORGANISM="Stephanopyxis turris, Strain CCMP 815" /LENGTH=554 /DNA_ID=CAMNT_0040642359 /DNA_START=30 /DNA_END=1691 /DNA_ORIENTATION=-